MPPIDLRIHFPLPTSNPCKGLVAGSSTDAKKWHFAHHVLKGIKEILLLPADTALPLFYCQKITPMMSLRSKENTSPELWADIIHYLWSGPRVLNSHDKELKLVCLKFEGLKDTTSHFPDTEKQFCPVLLSDHKEGC